MVTLTQSVWKISKILSNRWHALPPGRVTLIDLRAEAQPVTMLAKLPLLSSQIQSQWPLHEWLSGVYIAQDLSSAWQARENLTMDESIITRDGIWMGKNWVRINKAVNKDSGVLVREQELKQLTQQILIAREEMHNCKAQLEQGDVSLRQLEEQRELQHRAYQNISARLTETQTQLSGRQSRFAELQQQQQRLLRENQECDQSIQNLQDLLIKNREQYHHSSQVEQAQASQQAELLKERDQLRQELTPFAVRPTASANPPTNSWCASPPPKTS